MVKVRGGAGGSPWERGHGAPFSGLRIPFGSLVNFMPSDARRGVRHKFAPTSEPGIIMGYRLQPGSRWSGDYIVIRINDLRVPFEEHDYAPRSGIVC